MPPRAGHVPPLRRRRLGVGHLVLFTVAASAPLVVLAGGTTTTFAVGGDAGVPLSFLVLAAVLALFAVGYAAMSRHVANAGAFYSYLAGGLGRTSAVGGAFVALVAYNAIQIGLYGLFGAGMADFAAARFGVGLEWWVWALGALLAVGLLGVLRVDLGAGVLAVLLGLEVVVVLLHDVAALTGPAGGAPPAWDLDPTQLLVPEAAVVLAFGVAAFVGIESGAVHSEECRDPRRTVGRAMFVALAFTGVLYAVSAWAVTVAAGPQDLRAAAVQNGPGLVFGTIAERWGPAVADGAVVVFLTGVLAAMLSFHNGIARYLFVLGRERVLAAALDTVGTRSGGPVVGSLAQSTLAVAVVGAFAATGSDPVLELFTWLSGTAAVGVVLLMTATSAAVVGYFRRYPGSASTWQRVVAPGLAVVALGAVLVVLVADFDQLLGTVPASPLRWLPPAVVLVAGVVGIGWGLVLRSRRPAVHAGIGHVALAPEFDEPRLDLAPLPRG